MIDCENDIYSYIVAPLRAEFPGIYATGEYIDSPATFPAVMLFEADSSVYRKASTTNIENAEKVMWEVSVYSNLVSGRKAQAKKIMDFVDRKLAELGFTRTMMSPASNLMDATIYRIVARYEAVIYKDLWVYTE